MKFRSLIAVVMVFLMLMSFLPGCNSDSKNTNGNTTTASNNTQPSSGTATEKQPIDISIFNWSLNEFDPSKDEIAKIINEKFKITFTPVNLDGDDALKLAAAGNSLPEVFDTGPLYDPALFNQWITQGIVRELPEAMISKYPNIAKHVQNRTYETAKKMHDNKVYMLPRPTCTNPETYKVSWEGLYYRKDWLANVGIAKVPSTYDELYQMLKAFKQNDPDKNNNNDTYGLTVNGGMGLLNNWFTAWGINVEDWIKEDGKWIPSYLSKKCIEPLKYIQKLYQEGLIDTEFTSNSPVQAMQKFAGNTYGAIVRNSDTYWIYRLIVKEYGTANKSPDPLAVVGLIPTLAKDSNSEPLRAEQVDYDAIQFRSDMSDEKLDRFFEFYDWLLSEEARFLLNLGFEGVHYTKTPEGRIATSNDPATGTVYDIRKLYPSTNIINIVSWGFDNDADPNWPSTTIRDNIKQLAKEVRDARNPYSLPANLEFRLISTPAKDTLSVDLRADWANMVMSKDPIEPQFEAFIQKVLNSGGQQAIEETNAEAAKYGLN